MGAAKAPFNGGTRRPGAGSPLPPLATSASTSHPIASMPARMLLCTREIMGVFPTKGCGHGTSERAGGQGLTFSPGDFTPHIDAAGHGAYCGQAPDDWMVRRR